MISTKMFPRSFRVRDLGSGQESRVIGVHMVTRPAEVWSTSSDDDDEHPNVTSSEEDDNVEALHASNTPRYNSDIRNPGISRPPDVQLGTEGFFTTECGICLGKFKDGDKVTTLISCKHMAHTHCLRECYSSTVQSQRRQRRILSVQHHKCPFCRTTIKFPSKRHQQPSSASFSSASSSRKKPRIEPPVSS